MPYTITDQRALMKSTQRDAGDIEKYGFVLKHWEIDGHSTRVCFPSQQAAEEYIILKKLYGEVI